MYWHHGNYSDKHNLALMCQHFWKGFEFFYFTSFFRDLSQLYYKVYLRLCIWGVTACCLCSSWNFSPFPIYIAGKAMIFANSSSCIFQLQNLKPLWVSRIQSAKHCVWFFLLALLNTGRLSGGVLLVRHLAHSSVFSLPLLAVIPLSHFPARHRFLFLS